MTQFWLVSHKWRSARGCGKAFTFLTKRDVYKYCNSSYPSLPALRVKGYLGVPGEIHFTLTLVSPPFLSQLFPSKKGKRRRKILKEVVRTTLSPAQTKINLGGLQSRCLLTPEAGSRPALRTSGSGGLPPHGRVEGPLP